MMASTHTSASCSSPTSLDLPFAYTNYSGEQTSENPHVPHNHSHQINHPHPPPTGQMGHSHHQEQRGTHTHLEDQHDIPTNILSHSHSLHRDAAAPVMVPLHEKAIRYDFNPDYYSSPAHSNSTPPNASLSVDDRSRSSAFVRPSKEDDNSYASFIAVSEGDALKSYSRTAATTSTAATTMSNVKATSKPPPPVPPNPNASTVSNSNRYKSKLHSNKSMHATDTLPTTTIFIEADSYRYGSDILSLLLDADSISNHQMNEYHNNPNSREETYHVVGKCEIAQKAATDASKALQRGDFETAIQNHTISAREYRNVALSVHDFDPSLSNSLLVLSQVQAKHGTALLSLYYSHTLSVPSHSTNPNDSHPKADSKQVNDLNLVKISPSDIPTKKNSSSTNTNQTESTVSTPNEQSSSIQNHTHSSSSEINTTEYTTNQSHPTSPITRRSSISKEDKIRATIRGALNEKKEADITDSTFLGTASGVAATVAETITDKHGSQENHVKDSDIAHSNLHPENNSTNKEDGSKSKSVNPVDSLMKLERELKDMNMALKLGNSVASLSLTRTNTVSSRLKQSISLEDGSFCMVRPGSHSVSMGGSGIINPPSQQPQQSHRPYNNTNENLDAGIRARASRLHPFAKNDVSTIKPAPHVANHAHPQNSSHHNHNDDLSLDSSWWGNNSTHSSLSGAIHSHTMNDGGSFQSTSQSGSHHSNPHNHPNNHVQSHESSSFHNNHHYNHNTSNNTTNTKQVMRLLDSLKTLGDENAALLREVEEVHAARLEAKAAREQMKRFKAEYEKRYSILKIALEKVRSDGTNEGNPVNTSEYMTSKTLAGAKKKDLMIQKLAKDLRKEREESKKKDAALRKYENFYKEVKLKAMQRQKEQEKLARQKQEKLKSNTTASKSRSS